MTGNARIEYYYKVKIACYIVSYCYQLMRMFVYNGEFQIVQFITFAQCH